MLRDVDRLEHLGGGDAHAGIREEPLERRERSHVLGIAAERRGVVVERALDVVQLALVDLAELDAQRDRLFVRRREPEAAIVEIDDVGPAAVRAIQRLERADRIAALGRDVEHLLPRRDRVVGARERDVEPGGLDERADLVVDIGRGLGLAQQHLGEAHVVVGLAVDALERGERAAIVGLRVEDLLVVLARERQIAAHGARQIGDVEIQAPLDLGVEHVGRELAIRVDQLALAAELTGEALGLRDDLRELGLAARVPQRRELRGERAGLVAEPILAQAHDLGERAQLAGGLVAPVREAREQLRQPFVLPGRVVDGAQDVGGERAQFVIAERGLDGGERDLVALRILLCQHRRPA